MPTNAPRTASAPWWVTAFTPLATRLLGAGVPLPRTTPVAVIQVQGRR